MSQYKKSEDTRNLILNIALKLFYQKGYTGTTVRDIAKQSGLSISRMNYHFHSKAEVAAMICKSFLKNINDQINRITFPIINDLLLKDIIHIRIMAKAFLSKKKQMRFYYEIACENIITEILVDSGHIHFIEQADYLGLNLSKEVLRGYSHIFVAVLVDFIKSRHEGDPKLTEEQLLDLYNTLHLKLLNIEQNIQSNLLNKAKKIMNNMSFEMQDLSSITIHYRNTK